jgi:hypothetical protein
MVKKSKTLGATFRKELNSIDFKGLKDVQKFNAQIEGLNKTLKATNQLRETQVNLNKKVRDSQKQSNKVTADGVKLQKQSVETTKQEIASEQKKGAVERESIKNARERQKLAAEQSRTRQTQLREANALIRDKERLRKAAEKEKRTLLQTTNAYKKLTAETNAAQFQFKSLAAQFGVNSKQAQNALSKFTKLDGALRRINNTARDGRRDVGRYGLALKGLGGKFAGVGSQLVGALGVVGGIQLFAQVLRDSFNIIRNFGAEQSKLAGILGTTAENITELTELSKELGSTTVFTATEVSKAQIELAKLGLGADEITASLSGVLDSAVALGAGIPETAALVASSLKAFNLEAAESDRVAAVLSVSTTKSALDFEKLNTALGSVAPAAAAFGASIEETTGLLGLIVGKGIDASTAGTQLRNIFITLKAEGLTLEDALEKIGTSTDKLTTANELFGKRGAVTAIALADQRDKIKGATDAITDQDAALKALIEERLNNLDGDLKLLSSTWEGFILGVEDGSGVLNTIARGAIQTLIKTIGELREGLNDLGKPFTELFDEVRELGNALGVTVGEFNAFNILIETSKAAITPFRFLIEFIVGAFTGLVKIINAAIKGFQTASDAIKDFVSNNETLDAIIRRVGITVQFIKDKFDDFIGSIKEFISENRFLSVAVQSIKDDFNTFLDVLSKIKNQTDKVINSIIKLKNELLDSQVDASGFGEEYDKFGEKLTSAQIIAKNLAKSLDEVVKKTGELTDGTKELTGAIEIQSGVVSDLEKKKKSATEGDIARINQELLVARAELKRLQDLGLENDRLTKFKKEQQDLDNKIIDDRIALEEGFNKEIEALREKQIKSDSLEEIQKIEDQITGIKRDAEQARLLLDIEANNQEIKLIEDYSDVVEGSEQDILDLKRKNAEIRKTLDSNQYDDQVQNTIEYLEDKKELEDQETAILEKGLDDRLQLIEDFEENVSKLLDLVQQGLANQTQSRLDAITRSLEDNKKIQDELRQDAKDGNLEAQESLTIQKKKEAELEQERLRLEKQQRDRELAFAFLKILNTNLTTYQAKVEEARATKSPIPPNTVLVDSLTQGSLLAGAITTGFIDGTENVGRSMGNAPLDGAFDNYVGSVGSKVFKFDGDEAILNPAQNKKRGGLSNDETVDVAHRYLKGDLIEKSKVFDTAVSMTNALMALNSMKRGDNSNAMINALRMDMRVLTGEIKKLPSAMPTSHSGFNNKTGFVEHINKKLGREEKVLERLNRS